MKSRKVSLFVVSLLFMSFSMLAQKTTTPVLKSNPPVQEKVSPTIKKDTPGNTENQVLGVVTSPVRNIASTSAETGYTLTNAIGKVTRHGICLNRKPNPTTSCATFPGVNTSGSDFSVQLTGLPSSTTLYIRAFATTSSGTTYGNELSFTTAGSK